MSANPFQERFQHMLAASLVDQDTIEQTIALIKSVEQELGLALTEENGGAFAGHCALAIQRLRDGNYETEKSQDADEIVSEYPKLHALSRKVLSPYLRPESAEAVEREAALITLYLVAMTDDSDD